ncbi:MAG: hypothetical protein M3530_10745 [Thermoproteota archaeon]|nr:hypothetical protein [Thermoproteota archaeon]
MSDESIIKRIELSHNRERDSIISRWGSKTGFVNVLTIHTEALDANIFLL